MKSLNAKNWAMIVSGVGLVMWLVYAFMPMAVKVELATVGRGDIVVTIQDDGKTRVKDLYVISAPVTGRLLRIEKKVGDKVERAHTGLATIVAAKSDLLDSRAYEIAKAKLEATKSAYRAAEADRRSAMVKVQHSRTEFERVSTLFDQGTASQAELDRAGLIYNQSEEAALAVIELIQVREAEVVMANATLSPMEAAENGNAYNIISPISGSVFALHHESEGVVTAGTPLLSIGNVSELEIVADFLSASAVKVRKGAAVSIEGWGGERLLGKVRLVEPAGFLKVSALGIEEQRVNIIIDFDEPTTAFDKLGHGFRVEPIIVIDHKIDQVRAPISSLFRSDGGWAVFTVKDGMAKLTPVKIGVFNTNYASVLSGLTLGDTIILHPSDQIEDGVWVSGE